MSCNVFHVYKTALRLGILPVLAAVVYFLPGSATPAWSNGCNGVVDQLKWGCAIWDNNNGPQYPHYQPPNKPNANCVWVESKSDWYCPGQGSSGGTQPSATITTSGPGTGGTSGIIPSGAAALTPNTGGTSGIIASGAANLTANTGAALVGNSGGALVGNSGGALQQSQYGTQSLPANSGGASAPAAQPNRCSGHGRGACANGNTGG